MQRAQPCLSGPDREQVTALVDRISSLHLSTEEGSFIFASNSPSDVCTSTFVCSTGIDSIKGLPTSIWLPNSTDVKEKRQQEKAQYRLPMVDHLLSLPVNAFVSSSSSCSTLKSSETTIENQDQTPNRLPMVNQLLSMPINAFKSSSNTKTIDPSSSVKINDTQQRYDEEIFVTFPYDSNNRI